jgi:hypothetical protein
MVMRLAVTIAVAMLMAGCAVEGPAYERMTVAPAKAAVYVYRTYPTMGYGAGVQMPINCGDNSIMLGPGGYHVFMVDAGEVLCSSHLENTGNIELHAEPGHDYYLRGWVSMGILLPRVHLETVEAETAQPEIGQCKRQ